jgi:hypothetical protein
MLKHEVMAADEVHDNAPQDLVTVCQIKIKSNVISHVPNTTGVDLTVKSLLTSP